MQKKRNELQIMNILCVGEIQSGKTYFLKQFTRDQSKQTLCGPYDIYAKRINKNMVYFHQLSQEEDLYLQTFYNGIIFFVDVLNTWNVTQKILKWMQLQSNFTGQNTFKIPILIIITNPKKHRNQEKWKKMLQSQLKTMVNQDQIVYFQNISDVEDRVQLYIDQITNGKAQGIKPFKLYEINYRFKVFMTNLKIAFFRFIQMSNRNVKNKMNTLMKLNNKKDK